MSKFMVIFMVLVMVFDNTGSVFAIYTSALDTNPDYTQKDLEIAEAAIASI